MEYVSYEEFKKLDMRVGIIRYIEPVEGADKLLKCQVDFGEENLRQIVSGIREFFPEYESLVGKKVLYCINLEPRTIRGVESHGMLMAVDGTDGAPVFLIPDGEISPGTRVR